MLSEDKFYEKAGAFVLYPTVDDKYFTLDELKEAIKGKEVPNFFDYAYKRMEIIKSTVSYSTYKAYYAAIEKFEKYMGSRDVYFDDFTVTLLNDYKNYLNTKLNNGLTTQRLSIIVLGTIFNQAIKEDIIPETMFPFKKLTLKFDNTK
jgi:site-specific recombinase XerD